MGQNNIGALEVGKLTTAAPLYTNDVDLFPGMVKKWGLSFLINTAKTPEGRSPNSLAWAGLANTYFWIDPARNVSGVILMQLLPFADKICPGRLCRIRARHLCRDRRRQRTESGLSSLPSPRLRGARELLQVFPHRHGRA
jgi:CubicO group peptidase (beta-lactamase class C family)